MNLFEKLDEKNRKTVRIMQQKAAEASVSAYIVGGCVRDFILDKKIADLDFLIEGSAIEFAQHSGFKIKSLHEDFDTVKVEIEGIETDIASTRVETYPKCGCLPVVLKTGVSIEEDLKRRDFTINSIAWNINENKLIDPFLGANDIEKKVLKILHENSFKDDPTRILRGLDFKCRFGFDFDECEKKLIQNCTKSFDRAGLSIDRIYLTLKKIFKTEHANKILGEILDFEIYKIWTDKLGIKKEEIPLLDSVLDKFKGANKASLYLMALENCPYVKVRFKDDFEIYTFFKKFSLEQLCFYAFKTGDTSAQRYLEIKNIKPEITGHDLIEAGFKQGETIGHALNAILKEKVLNGEKFKTREDELNFAILNFKN